MPSFPQGTDEFQPFFVTVNDTRVYTGVKVAILRTGLRPIESDWVDPESVDGQLAVKVTPFAVGLWHIWAQATTSSEKVLVYSGNFRVIK